MSPKKRKTKSSFQLKEIEPILRKKLRYIFFFWNLVKKHKCMFQEMKEEIKLCHHIKTGEL